MRIPIQRDELRFVNGPGYERPRRELLCPR